MSEVHTCRISHDVPRDGALCTRDRDPVRPTPVGSATDRVILSEVFIIAQECRFQSNHLAGPIWLLTIVVLRQLFWAPSLHKEGQNALVDTFTSMKTHMMC